MKCLPHGVEAFAVCAWCGRGLCTDCAKTSETKRMICSDVCGTALKKSEQGWQQLLQKNQQGARASAFNSFLCGGLSAAGAVGAHLYLPVPFLVWFTAGCSVVFIASGIWYCRVARNRNL